MKHLTLIASALIIPPLLYGAYVLGTWNIEYSLLVENAELRERIKSRNIQLEAYSDALNGKFILEQLGLPEKEKVEVEK